MRTILRIQFGSHLYGTSTPASDQDFKSIFVPDARSILLQRAKGTMSTHRPKGLGEKNSAGEVDEESFSLQRYLGLIAEGQTVALDVLFSPASAQLEPCGTEWLEILANRHRLVSRKSAAFVGYCRQQAQKYGIKGSRVAAARSALLALEGAVVAGMSSKKLEDLASNIDALVGRTEHMTVLDQPMANGGSVRHWEVCGRKMPFTSSVKNARDIMQRLVDEYGQRALMAESQQGVDWKALSHAVRIANQAIELLGTGHITLPLADAKHILEIKTGQRLYQDVAAEIEDLLEQVEAAAIASSLPDQPDVEWIDDFVADVYKKEILR